MIKINSNMIAFFDVDDTLVEWEMSNANDNLSLMFTLNGKSVYKRPIITHVNELINQKLTGTTIVVWSAGGVDWAECVVKTLKLEKYVDLVITKPTRLYDDKDASYWLPKRRYLI